MIVIKENNNDYRFIGASVSISNLYIKLKKYGLAKEYAEKALQKAEALEYPLGIAQVFITLAELAKEEKNYRQAISYAEKSLSVKLTYINQAAYGILRESHAELKNYDKAYDYLWKEKILHDSLFTVESEAKIKELEIMHEVQQKEQENEFLKLEQLANHQTIQNRNYLSITLFLGLLLVGSWGFLIYKANLQKRKDNQSLKSKNKQLQELNKLKTQFFSNISHEFKTPLTLIISPLKQLLRQKNITTEQRFLVKTAEQNSTQLLELTQQLLELMKLDVEQIHVQSSTVDFTKTLKMLFANFESLTKTNHIDFHLNYTRTTPLFIETDVYKLKTILKNLLSNAIKYTAENGQIEVNVTEQSNDLKIEVQDNGQGIHSYDLPHIFNRFYQANPKNNLGGTGIGLAICKEYATILGGSIQVKSEWGKGSTFTVIIPKVEVQPPNHVLQQSLPILTPDKIITPTKTNHSTRILIVEDNLDMQNYIRFTLNDYYTTVGVSNGKQALEKLKQQDFDLIITDMMMPEMDGMEFINQVKSTPKLNSIPLIMLSAVSDSTKKIDALRIGIDDYITKPFEAEELLIRIEHLLQFYQERTIVQSTEIVKKSIDNKKDESIKKVVSHSEGEQAWLNSLETVCLNNLDRTDFNMKQLAYEMAMSYSNLWRKTNKIIGMTPTQYLQEIRFREAQRMLIHQEVHSVKQLAYKVGYKDEKYFSRNFKKRFGKYPSKYLE